MMKNRLGLVLLAMGMHQNELARKINVKYTTISMYVNGKRTPNLEMALRISNALGVKVEDIWQL